MIRRTVLGVFVLVGIARIASATSIFDIALSITGPLTAPGYIDVQFNPIVGTPIVATARIANFQQTGFTLPGAFSTSGRGVTGSFNSPPLIIPDDEGAANYYTHDVTAWGSHFSFRVTFDITSPGTEGATLFLTLLDSSFAPQGGNSLPNGEIPNITLNPDGTGTSDAGAFAAGSSSVTAVPEPSTALGGVLALGVGALVAWRRVGSFSSCTMMRNGPSGAAGRSRALHLVHGPLDFLGDRLVRASTIILRSELP